MRHSSNKKLEEMKSWEKEEKEIEKYRLFTTSDDDTLSSLVRACTSLNDGRMTGSGANRSRDHGHMA
ncbi:hypothetical protein RRG08_021192 [Elysia crispata]|uniref:Uncharacterized protein n=1 Tax=Elysia crispata TaxID=231223 RepID=A0AAE1D276_9GAST|nr:hypothetical protein RRG08_021192 [Elysia crispata]